MEGLMRFKGCLFVFLTVLLLSRVASAETIRSIEVKGNTITSSDTIIGIIQSRVGSEFSETLIDKDVKALFNSGRFKDVWIEHFYENGGVRLVINVVETPIVTKLVFEGNKVIKAKKLEKEIKLNLYSQISQSSILEAIDKIKEMYEKKGYNLVEVTYDIRPLEQGQAELVFKIKENSKAYINRVSFVGNKVFSDSKLRRIIRSKKRGIFSFITSSGKLKQELIDADIALLNQHYLNNGYLRASITPPTIEITKDKKYIYITYAIEEGKRYRVKNVNVGGDILTTPEEIISKLSLKSGEFYDQRKVNADIDMLTVMYGNEGYAFANIRPVPELNDNDGTVDVTYFIEKGKRIRIEKINIIGNKTTRDKVIRRELKIKENDIYNEDAVRLSRIKLMQLGYFESVNFSTPRGSRDDSLILNIEVKERPTGSFNVGAGFSTVDKFIFSGSISKENFFGYGWSGTIAAEISKRTQLFYLEAEDPYFLDTNWILGFSGYREMYRYQDFDKKTLGGGISLGRRLFDFSSVSLGYSFEDASITDFTVVIPDAFKSGLSGKTSNVSLTISRDTRDNRITPNKGSYNAIDLSYSGSSIGADRDFFRVVANSRWYLPIKWGVVFKCQGKIGYVKSLDENLVPLFERFYLGGPNSLRGYYPLSVGPSTKTTFVSTGEPTDFVYGGNKMLLFNAEFELPLYEPAGFKGVVFFDAGNAFGETENYSFKNLRMNYGFGIRWNSPMGPFRFEWGLPINRRPGDEKVVFNFMIGNFF